MAGNTKDLMDENNFSADITKLFQFKLGIPEMTREVVVRLMGIKRQNISIGK
jgi:hypothetical protein